MPERDTRGRIKAIAAGTNVRERDGNTQLAAYCAALASPVRVRILKLLIREECIFGDLARSIPLAQSTISEHLRILKNAGLVCSETQGQTTSYCIVREELVRMRGMIDLLLPRGDQHEKSTPGRMRT